MYKFLLSMVDKEVMELFEYFLNSRLHNFRISDISNEFKWSRNKILIVLNRAQSLQEKYPTFFLEVASSKVYFTVTNEFLLSKLYSIVLEETVYFNMLDLFFREGFMTLEKVAQQYFYSDRTIQRKLKEVEEVLEIYHIRLNLKKNKIFRGSEYMIRYFFHLLYWQKFDESNELKIGITQESREFLKRQLREQETKFRNIDIDKFLQIVSVSFFRVKKKNFISELPADITNLKHAYIDYDTFKKSFLEPVVIQNNMKFFWSEKEYLYLYYMFSAITTYLPTDIDDIRMEDVYSGKHFSIVTKFIDEVEKEFGITFNQNDRAYVGANMLVVNSTSFVFSTKQKIDAFGKTSTEMDYSQLLPNIYFKVRKVYQSLSENSNIYREMYRSNNRIIFQYSMILSLLIPQYSQKKIRVFHESKFGKIQEERQKKKILKTLGDTIKFVEKNPDIVLTDYPVDRDIYISMNRKVKFFQWRSFQTNENWLEFIEMIDRDFL